MRIRIRTYAVVMPLCLSVAGCPSPVEHRYGVADEPREPIVSEDDPRVAKQGDDLYPAEVVERAAAKGLPPQPRAGRGSGKPDESNGKCRLYAPKLPEPECCKPAFGFDVETVRDACGLEVYMGESWQNTCGYYFHTVDGRDTWFRASFINAKTAEQAALSQARQLREKVAATQLQVEPVPGTKDAYWMTHDRFGWAYMGGWPAVRQFAWREDACSAEGVAEVIAEMESAAVPPKGAERLALVPKARG